MDLELLAQGAYHAYGLCVDFKNYQGNPMPTWEDLTPEIRAAWRGSADFVQMVSTMKAGDHPASIVLPIEDQKMDHIDPANGVRLCA